MLHHSEKKYIELSQR